MAHKFIDISEITGRTKSGGMELKEALVKLAEGVSQGKAALIDCEKFKRKPLTVAMMIRALVKSGTLTGFDVITRNKCQDVYLVKP